MPDLDLEYERLQGAIADNILTMLVWHPDCYLVVDAVAPKLFESPTYTKIATAAVDYIERYGRPPRAHIRDFFEKELRNPTAGEGKLLADVIDATARLERDLNPQFVTDHMMDWVRLANKRLRLEQALDAVMRGDEIAADRTLADMPVATGGNSVGLWLHDDNLEFMTYTESEFFSSGVDELDRRGIRPERGTLTLMIAPKKAGKSWWCVNLGKAGVQWRKKVLHVTLENSERLTKRRYVQSFFGLTKRQTQNVKLPKIRNPRTGELELPSFVTSQAMSLEEPNHGEIQRQLRKLELREHLLIKEFPTGTLTVSALNFYLDRLARKEKFEPDLLIVDMPDLMALNADRLRVDTGIMLKQLRGIAVSRNMALCAPTQGNRASDTAGTVTSSHVSEDWSKVGTADTVLTYNRTEPERRRGLARILVDAARDEEDRFLVLITQSYVTGQFCIDSQYFDKQIAEDIREADALEELDTSKPSPDSNKRRQPSLTGLPAHEGDTE